MVSRVNRRQTIANIYKDKKEYLKALSLVEYN